MPDDKPTRKVSIYSHPKLSMHELRRIGVAAGCDPRAVVKYLKDLNITAMSRVRVERGLRKCGYAHLIRRTDDDAGTAASTNASAPVAPPPETQNGSSRGGTAEASHDDSAIAPVRNARPELRAVARKRA